MSAAYVKMHDAWLTDPRIQWLLERQEVGAVVLFWSLICHSHAHDSDGFITRGEALNEARSAWLPDGRGAMRALKSAGLVTNVGRSGYEVVRYRKWQTTSDQRKDHAERMRTSRARDSGVRPKREREKEREHVPPARAAQEDEDGPGRPVFLGDDARRVLADLKRRKGNSDG